MSNTYDKKFWTQLILAVFFLVLAVYANKLATDYVNGLSYDGLDRDLLHELFPVQYIYSVLSEIFLIIVVLLFFFHMIYRKMYYKIPVFITVFAIFYSVRAIILPLTPLADPYPLAKDFGILSGILLTGGTFPSGHTGLVFLMFLLIEPNNITDKIIKYTILFFTILTGFFVIISRGHYTIDVVGGVLIAYTIYSLMKEKKFITETV